MYNDLKPHELLAKIYRGSYYTTIGNFVHHMKEPLFADGYSLTIVHSEGGGEGDGEYVELVIMIEGQNYIGYVMINGFYNSYEGTWWEDPNEWCTVEPREVVVTQYFAKD